MPKFSYTVINPEGATLNGVIDAVNESGAREKLNKMDFSVVDISPISEEEEKAVTEEIIRYEFEGVDKNGRVVKGTIDSSDRYSAFKRLIREYHIEVSSICAGAESLEKKEAEKAKGVLDLYLQFKKEEAGSIDKKKKTLHETEETERAYINEQIDFVIKKVEELLKNFADMVKPEETASIEKKRDRLLRMKASANIPYLEHLCEELLNYIQNQEIYAAQKSKDERVQKFNLEIKRMLSDMQRTKIKKSARMRILESISRWRENNIENTQQPAFIKNAINKILSVIEQWLEEDPRITDAKMRAKLTDEKIKDYKKIYKKEISEEYRREMLESIKRLQYEKEQIFEEIKNLKRSIKEEMEGPEKSSILNKIIKEFSALTGFLLAFYLAFYLISEYLFVKDFGIDPSVSIYSVAKSEQFHYLIAILFIINAVLGIKNLFLKKNLAGAILALPLIFILSILVILNF